MSPLKAVLCTEFICLRRCHFKSAMSAMMNAKATPPTIPPIIAPRWLGFEALEALLEGMNGPAVFVVGSVWLGV